MTQSLDDIDAVILAAGLSSRAGGFKPLFPFGGSSLIRHTIDNFRPFCHRIIVVGGHCFDELQEHLLGQSSIEVYFNPDYEQGMFSSVKWGLSQVQGRRCFLIPGDMPLISGDLLGRMLASSGDVVLPSFNRQSGHPVLLDSRLIPAILAAAPDSTLRSILQGQPRYYLETNDPGVLLDVDTPEDYQNLQQRRVGPTGACVRKNK